MNQKPQEHMKKIWKEYQVVPKNGPTKTVAELTESEAKDELCAAMRLIDKLCNKANSALMDARDARYWL